MTRISIAMATYNGERFISEQLDSFARQTLLPDELIVCDDASSDATVDIIEAFANRAPFRTRIERNQDNLGYSQNFGRALSLCGGDVVFISDQDDVWYPDKIATVLSAMETAAQPIVTVNDQRIADADGSERARTIFENARRVGFSDAHLIAGSCTALPQPLLDIVLPIPPEFPYDSWIGLTANSLDLKLLIRRPLQLFRRHGANSSQPIAVSPSAGRLSEFMRYGFADPRAGWSRELAGRAELVARFENAPERFRRAVGEEALKRGIDVNRKRMEALRRRTAMLDLPRWRRPPVISNAWRGGVYEEFEGWRSALKDLIRPART